MAKSNVIDSELAPIRRVEFQRADSTSASNSGSFEDVLAARGNGRCPHVDVLGDSDFLSLDNFLRSIPSSPAECSLTDRNINCQK